MGIVNSKTGVEKKEDIASLEQIAKSMRIFELISLFCAKSGHPGGCLSITDITAALYFNVAKHDPENPDWDKRDRIVFSAGHKAPALYTALAMSGYFPIKELMTLRKLDSRLQGHPHTLKLQGVEISTGSLGQGLSNAVGMASAAKFNNQKNKVFCIMGDGEQQEGQIWEAAMQAAHHNLDNIIAVVDKNNLQIDGPVKDVSNIDPLKEKYEAFGWNVFEINGHNMQEIVETLEKAYNLQNKKPTLIIADTVKGKGVSFMENEAGWHGKELKSSDFYNALKKINAGISDKDVEDFIKHSVDCQKKITKEIMQKIPNYKPEYDWNAQKNLMCVKTEKTRAGFGDAIAKVGRENKLIIPLGADISGSINLSDFYTKNKHLSEEEMTKLKKRFISLGIAEQSIASVAAGLAKEGFFPVFGTYGVFSAGRALDQLRMLAYDNANVLVLGAHAGVSVGPDGATHQALEDLSAMLALPNMNIEVPSDFVETRKAGEYLLTADIGPKYLRYARESTPIITREDTPYEIGKANVIKYRGQQENFIDAFETVLAEDYNKDETERDAVSIITCGPITAEAMRAAWILKEEYCLNARVVNIHTLKHYKTIKDEKGKILERRLNILDHDAIINAANETGIIVTLEEHQTINGFGSTVASELLEHGYSGEFGKIGVNNRFGQSGTPDELAIEYELRAENIVDKVLELNKFKQQKKF